MSWRNAAVWLLVGACALAVSCLRPEPIVEHHTHALAPGALTKVAVIPFYPQLRRERSDAPLAVSAADAADLVSRFVSEALQAAGVPTLPASDLMLAFEGAGKVVPRQDVQAVATLAAQQFGATAVLLGRVMRYRARDSGSLAVPRPASVWFEVDLHTAPKGERIFSARFDQTQQTLTANVFIARQYPGGGSRWLTVGELARWGAEHVVKTLRATRR